MATLLAGVDVPLLVADASALPPIGSSLATFIATLTGKTVDSCGGFPSGQCTALACLWARNLGLGTPCGSCGAPDHCDGVCWQGSGFAGWTWIPNTPTNVPSPGDLVCYHQCAADGIGASGHVGIFESGNVNSFTGFDQNWAGAFCALHTHGYECVVGWQHPNAGMPSSNPPSSGGVGTCPPGQLQVGSFCYPEVASYGSPLPLGLFLGGLTLLGIYAYERSPQLHSRVDAGVRGAERRLGLIRESRPR